MLSEVARHMIIMVGAYSWFLATFADVVVVAAVGFLGRYLKGFLCA